MKHKLFTIRSMSIYFQHHNFYSQRPKLKLKFHIAERFGVLLGIGVENDVNLYVSQLYCQHYYKNVKISSVVNLELQVPLTLLGVRVSTPPPPAH